MTSVVSFITIVKVGIPDLNGAKLDELQATLIWTELADAIQSFLFYDDRRALPTAPDVVKRDEALDIMLADLVAKDMASNSAPVTEHY
jgi:hypothetical protein